MQSITFKSVLAILVLSILVTACSSRASEQDKKNPPAATAPAALPVDVKIVSPASLELTETVAGSVVANRTVDIMSELTKKVTAVYFKDGSHVQQGQVLYKLDDADIRAKMRQLHAELNLARINENRFRELLKTETVRQEEYDIALSRLQALQATQDMLQVELSKTNVRAPFAGIIGISKVFAGTLVSPGMPLVSLQEQGVLKIRFDVSEKYLPLVKAGNKIRFTTELGGEKLTAVIISAEAAVDMQSRHITVEAAADNRGGKLKAGMSAKVYFNTSGEAVSGIMIPTESLIPGGNGYSVFVVKNGQAKITPVTIANRNEREALISAGLQAGDTVMISNILRAADGIPVSVVNGK